MNFKMTDGHWQNAQGRTIGFSYSDTFQHLILAPPAGGPPELAFAPAQSIKNMRQPPANPLFWSLEAKQYSHAINFPFDDPRRTSQYLQSSTQP
jgi:hypothetical protein